jgi:hypothetical protein
LKWKSDLTNYCAPLFHSAGIKTQLKECALQRIVSRVVNALKNVHLKQSLSTKIHIRSISINVMSAEIAILHVQLTPLSTCKVNKI